MFVWGRARDPGKRSLVGRKCVFCVIVHVSGFSACTDGMYRCVQSGQVHAVGVDMTDKIHLLSLSLIVSYESLVRTIVMVGWLKSRYLTDVRTNQMFK